MNGSILIKREIKSQNKLTSCLAAPMRERGSVQVEEYREDGLYLEGIVKTEDLHCFEGYLV